LITVIREEIVMVPKEYRKRHKRPKESSHSKGMAPVKKRTSGDVLFQPWFLSKAVAQAILRLIPLEYIARMRWYFEDYGCIRCKRKKNKVMYGASGFCVDCGPKVRRCLVQSMKRRGNISTRPELAESQQWHFNRAQAAENLLADLVLSKPRLIADLPPIETKRTRAKTFWRI
jgi:hypothetical protein